MLTVEKKNATRSNDNGKMNSVYVNLGSKLLVLLDGIAAFNM